MSSSDSDSFDNSFHNTDSPLIDENVKNFLNSLPYELGNILQGCICDIDREAKWKDIIGLKKIKETFLLNIYIAPRYPSIFKGIRKPLRNFILYGPPGNGKTFIARTLATMTKRKFLLVTKSVISSMWVGNTAKLIKAVFDLAVLMSPSILFFDEMDGICSKRRSADSNYDRENKSELLVKFEEMSKKQKDVCVIGATNFPWDIDPAIKRRFDTEIYIPLPCLKDIKKILIKNLSELEIDNDFNFDNVAQKLIGYSASDIVRICKLAVNKPIQEFFSSIKFDLSKLKNADMIPKFFVKEEDFYYVIEKTPSTITKSMIQEYYIYKSDK
ncbi:AAA+ ATPase domain and ATPase, AAA-type, core domain and P-loop containing nucleoside triphosphate hydrolase domain-containing protein [Strongyloides ratti]|uniref:AAA+ ATPase domain and ATPase, AAA-type, core domain and P-loop containing nucleoside triphosphate hydrolase domain-containing protein n=1 Tax=Strongyloides ratti TaxID=34506 RepID=A0A090N0A1_STRRB|nr:AAA+ ATPase domain and ATPase, AAA-type, core domain and P-loop containing nucleoside triphosphate hydrolase domain-containing protein [Strongyloides ratti]CEF70325.1 AAA+ ATPase domain and ATPase, AAA-type, core domain and P-loop containing nucleoside triphosphate hydrolase domain-containing protein [Strongyloides ratti]